MKLTDKQLKEWENEAQSDVERSRDLVALAYERGHRINILIKALRIQEKTLLFAAGYISGLPKFKNKHPQEILDWLLEEAKKL